MYLARFPRLSLAHLPTPLEPMPRLSAALGGPEIWIKRDDCTGLSTGGNKTRKLEFLMADALEQGAQMVMTQGATQSNHARQTAAAAARLGLGCHILLEDRTGSGAHNYNNNGNVLLDHLHGATSEMRLAGGDMNAALEAAAEDRRPAAPASMPFPAAGRTRRAWLCECGLQTLAQANDAGIVFDHFITAVESAGTQAGLVTGLKAMNAGLPLLESAPARHATGRRTMPACRRHGRKAWLRRDVGVPMSSPTAIMSAMATDPDAGMPRGFSLFAEWLACSTRSIRRRRRPA